ncbi:MAG: hypothetical protein ABR980_07720 [Ignavibacteriaceae bacterium]|jgi:hypothetical protein
MGNIKFRFFNKILILTLLFSIIIVNESCHVQLIANYDQTAIDDIIHTYREVDQFYISLLNVPPDQRTFQNYSKNYYSIESDIGIMVLKNSARPLNTESSKIAQNILIMWRKHKDEHKKKNSYDDVLLTFDRETFFDNFSAMLIAEQSKPKEGN